MGECSVASLNKGKQRRKRREVMLKRGTDTDMICSSLIHWKDWLTTRPVLVTNKSHRTFNPMSESKDLSSFGRKAGFGTFYPFLIFLSHHRKYLLMIIQLNLMKEFTSRTFLFTSNTFLFQICLESSLAMCSETQAGFQTSSLGMHLRGACKFRRMLSLK